MDIRPLAQNDLVSLLILFRDLHKLDEPLPPSEKVERTWSEVLATSRSVCFGGFIGADLVSSSTVTVIPNLTRGCRPYGLVENVVTSSRHRRRGYGSALLRAALSHAWSTGCYKVMLLTGRKDEATFRFYRSAGFDENEKQAFVAKPAA